MNNLMIARNTDGAALVEQATVGVRVRASGGHAGYTHQVRRQTMAATSLQGCMDVLTLPIFALATRAVLQAV